MASGPPLHGRFSSHDSTFRLPVCDRLSANDMETDSQLVRARDLFERRDWVAARDAFLEARRTEQLDASDLTKLADAVWWLGSFREAQSLYEQSYDLYQQENRPRQAAMSAL